MLQKEREISRRLVLATIGEAGATRAQIAHACGHSKNGMSRLMKSLRDDKLIYIGAWISRTDELTGERKPGMPFAVYMLGDKKDVPRPKPLCKRKIQAKYQKTHRAVIRAKTMARKGTINMWDQLRYAA